MIRAAYNDKNLVVNILINSFANNKSVNYIIKQDKKKDQRIKALMEYSFDVCLLFGDVFLSGDNKACALIVYPDKKTTTLKSILLNARLILLCVGLKNIKKALDREELIKKIQPKELMSYLWFIGVDPKHQNVGVGSSLLTDIIKYSNQKGRPLYLETSTVKNLPWYKKFQFEIYSEQYLDYRLYFLRRSITN